MYGYNPSPSVDYNNMSKLDFVLPNFNKSSKRNTIVHMPGQMEVEEDEAEEYCYIPIFDLV